MKMSMNLEVARRMEENKDLSDKRVKILQEKRDRLKEEAKAQEHYHMSVYQVSLKQRVENFSKRNRWIVTTQVRTSYFNSAWIRKNPQTMFFRKYRNSSNHHVGK